MHKVTISIANNFSAYPAGRYPADGEYNATAFRKEWLLPALTDDARVAVTFDDVDGLAALVPGRSIRWPHPQRRHEQGISGFAPALDNDRTGARGIYELGSAIH